MYDAVIYSRMSEETAGNSSSPRTIGSDETLFDIIEYLRQNGPAGVTEISNAVGISKSTAHLHVKTATAKGYAVKSDGRYDLSLRFLDAGLSRKYRNDIFETIDPRLDKLAIETGEQVWFWVEENGRAVVISQALGTNALSTNGRMGTHLHMHCTAGGKALLAHLGRDRVEEIVDRHGLPEQTDNTITSRERLFEEFEEIRETGFAINQGESIKGVFAIATPVIDNNETLHGAISIAAPKKRMEDPLESENAEAIMEAADELGINLSYV
jgi:IclR family acetate operon transcriptional repressor